MSSEKIITPEEFTSRLIIVSGSMSDLHRTTIEAGDMPYDIVTNPDIFLDDESAKKSIQNAVGRLGARLVRLARGQDEFLDSDREAAEAQLYDPIWVQVGLNKLLGSIASKTFIDKDQDFDSFITSISVSPGDGIIFANNGKSIEVAHNTGELFTPTENRDKNERVSVESVSTIKINDENSLFMHKISTKQRFITGFGVADMDFRTDIIDYDLELPVQSDLPNRLLVSIEHAVQDLRSMRPKSLRSAVAGSLASN